jgi:hypothetical protein
VTKRDLFTRHQTNDLALPFEARVRKELIKLPEVVFDELPNRVQGVVLSVKLVLVGVVAFSSAMSTPDMRIWKSLRLILLMFAIQMSFSRIDTGPHQSIVRPFGNSTDWCLYPLW